MNAEIEFSRLKQKSLSYSPPELVDELGFDQSLKEARKMLLNEEWDESLQEYATSILEEVRKKFPHAWNANWKYDALLGYAYHIILKYDERYAAYKRALDKAESPPPELLTALARCYIAPGIPPISEEEAILMTKQAISTKMYIESVELLRGLYKSTGNIQEQKYWENVLEDIKDTGEHLRPLDQI